MTRSAMILGLAGAELTPSARDFFQDIKPFGFILFARNLERPDQLRRLTASLRDLTGREDLPILIDQEGGRVQRLRAPHWSEQPPAGAVGELAARDRAAGLRAAFLHAHLIGLQLADHGITVDCAPCLDLRVAGASNVIGDRSYGADPALVAELGVGACDGFLAAGVVPVVKHLPGHGRALVDSHKDLPVLDAPIDLLRDTDFVPFRSAARGAWGMTAHIVLEAVDADRPATLSHAVISEVIRGEIGFTGPLMSDDLSMEALAGPLGDRAADALAAGCDLALHCNGNMAEMQAVAAATGPLSAAARDRLDACPVPARPGAVTAADRSEMQRELAALLAR